MKRVTGGSLPAEIWTNFMYRVGRKLHWILTYMGASWKESLSLTACRLAIPAGQCSAESGSYLFVFFEGYGLICLAPRGHRRTNPVPTLGINHSEDHLPAIICPLL